MERDRIDIPGRDSIADDLRPGGWRRDMDESGAGYFWPVALVVGVLIAAMLLFTNSTDTPNTQVGQNTERPTTTTTPKAPTTPQPQ